MSIEKPYKFKECRECHACCDGFLIGNAYGNYFGKGKKCLFLVDNNCTIYENRPYTCKKFQCAWTQNLFEEEDMRPDKSGLLVSVEEENGKQYLVVVIMKPIIESKYYKIVENFCERNGTYFKIKRIGSD